MWFGYTVVYCVGRRGGGIRLMSCLRIVYSSSISIPTGVRSVL